MSFSLPDKEEIEEILNEWGGKAPETSKYIYVDRRTGREIPVTDPKQIAWCDQQFELAKPFFDWADEHPTVT